MAVKVGEVLSKAAQLTGFLKQCLQEAKQPTRSRDPAVADEAV